MPVETFYQTSVLGMGVIFDDYAGKSVAFSLLKYLFQSGETIECASFLIADNHDAAAVNVHNMRVKALTGCAENAQGNIVVGRILRCSAVATVHAYVEVGAL